MSDGLSDGDFFRDGLIFQEGEGENAGIILPGVNISVGMSGWVFGFPWSITSLHV